MIDLLPLHNNIKEKEIIDSEFNITEDYYKKTDIKKINKLYAKGYIKRVTDDDDYIKLDVKGEMILLDSISLEEINYPFSFKIEGNLTEILGNCPNSLDILELLWENIVLEVPLKYTKETDLSKFQGEGWRLLDEEEEKNSNNPFNDILKEFGKE